MIEVQLKQKFETKWVLAVLNIKFFLLFALIAFLCRWHLQLKFDGAMVRSHNVRVDNIVMEPLLRFSLKIKLVSKTKDNYSQG